MLGYVLEPVIAFVADAACLIIEQIFNYIALPLFEYGVVELTAYLACF